MEAKTIKIRKETYVKLSELAGELQMKLKRPVSLDEAMQYLIRLRRREGARITDLAGSWSMSDDEWATIRKSLSKAWERWRLTKSES